jgi:hypothetical protein
MFYILRKQRGRRSARAAQLSGERDLLPGSYNEASYTWEISAARQRSWAQGLGREAENFYVLEPHLNQDIRGTFQLRPVIQT